MNSEEQIQIGIAIAAIVVGATIVAVCFKKANAILKKDDALWAEEPSIQN